MTMLSLGFGTIVSRMRRFRLHIEMQLRYWEFGEKGLLRNEQIEVLIFEDVGDCLVTAGRGKREAF